MAKVAILIDGGFFLKRLKVVRPQINRNNPDEVVNAVYQLTKSHLNNINKTYNAHDCFELLYRTFYYDAKPYQGKEHTPVGNRTIDFARTPQAEFRSKLFDGLRGSRDIAVRLGEVRINRNHRWVMRPSAQSDLIKSQRDVADLLDDDFTLGIRQKGVDMRIGLDIASLTLKRQVDIIILVSGDADFVPAAKLARREGVKFVLDPLWHPIATDLNEHIDWLTSGFPNPTTKS